MKKNLKKAAFFAAIMSVCVIVASCQSGETLEVKAKGGETIQVTNGYETSLLITNSNVTNNGTESVGTIKGIGSITTDTGSENPLNYTLDTNIEAKVALSKNIITVSAENAGIVNMTEKSTASESDLSTEETLKKFYT